MKHTDIYHQILQFTDGEHVDMKIVDEIYEHYIKHQEELCIVAIAMYLQHNKIKQDDITPTRFGISVLRRTLKRDFKHFISKFTHI